MKSRTFCLINNLFIYLIINGWYLSAVVMSYMVNMNNDVLVVLACSLEWYCMFGMFATDVFNVYCMVLCMLATDVFSVSGRRHFIIFIISRWVNTIISYNVYTVNVHVVKSKIQIERKHSWFSRIFIPLFFSRVWYISSMCPSWL